MENIKQTRLGMLYYTYLSLHRIDLCEKTLKQMKSVAEEDVLTYLCGVYHAVIDETFFLIFRFIQENMKMLWIWLKK